MDITEITCEVVEWAHLVHNRNQWRAFVNTEMNIQAPRKGTGEFLSS
jgi:hypothetical protein